MNEKNNLSLMAVLAHPDDESFGMGGTLAKYAAEGVDCYLICATRGEVGEMDATYLEGFNSPAERRQYELMCAANQLGLKEVFFLEYRDSGMEGSEDNSHPQSLYAAELDKVAGDIVRLIRQLKPDVLITFDPIGGYRHPDHIKIHQATVRAFKLSSDPDYLSADGLQPFQVSKLYFHTMPKTMLIWAIRFLRLMRKDPTRFGKNQDIDLVSIASVQFHTHAVIDFRNVALKRSEAAACHSSQGGKKSGGGLVSQIQRFFLSKDWFMRAFPEVIDGEPIEKDLFSGLRN